MEKTNKEQFNQQDTHQGIHPDNRVWVRTDAEPVNSVAVSWKSTPPSWFLFLYSSHLKIIKQITTIDKDNQNKNKMQFLHDDLIHC